MPLQQLLAGEVPIATALSFLLRLGTAGLGSPVELEFALKMRRRPSERHQLHLLQIRPQAKLSAKATARFAFLPDQEYAAIASKRALGHGRFDGVLDVVYVSPNRFEKHNTRRMAQEISAINRKMQTAGRKYLLMAPGRWGSADETTGIPVSWENITSCGVIVETVLDKQVQSCQAPSRLRYGNSAPVPVTLSGPTLTGLALLPEHHLLWLRIHYNRPFGHAGSCKRKRSGRLRLLGCAAGDCTWDKVRLLCRPAGHWLAMTFPPQLQVRATRCA